MKFRVEMQRETIVRTWIDVEALDAAAADEAVANWLNGDVASEAWFKEASDNEYVKESYSLEVMSGTRPAPAEDDGASVSAGVLDFHAFEDCDMCRGVGSVGVRGENCSQCEQRWAAMSQAKRDAEMEKARDRVADLCLSVIAEHGIDAVDRMALEMSGDRDLDN